MNSRVPKFFNWNSAVSIVIIVSLCIATFWHFSKRKSGIKTVEHDGHLWIVPSDGSGSVIIHHPDCKHESHKPRRR